MSKVKDILKAGAGIGKLFAPGAVGSILDIVEKSILDDKDPGNTAGLKAVAQENEDQNQVLVNHEKRLRAIEDKLGM